LACSLLSHGEGNHAIAVAMHDESRLLDLTQLQVVLEVRQLVFHGAPVVWVNRDLMAGSHTDLHVLHSTRVILDALASFRLFFSVFSGAHPENLGDHLDGSSTLCLSSHCDARKHELSGHLVHFTFIRRTIVASNRDFKQEAVKTIAVSDSEAARAWSTARDAEDCCNLLNFESIK